MRIETTLTSPESDSFRAAKVRGHFDVPTDFVNAVEIVAELPLDDDEWTVGLITGASGSGKSTIAREFGGAYVGPDDFRRWDGLAIVDDFPESMSPEDVVNILSAVGLSSVPAWLRPYSALSTGEKFRARLAITIAEAIERGSRFVVFDEFTSVVDRHVAKAASHAVAKFVRERTRSLKFIAVTCHRDVAPWLAADWVYDVDTAAFSWGFLQRPGIDIAIREASKESWGAFRRHHYLSGDLSPAARVFLAEVNLDGDSVTAGFFSILPAMNRWQQRGWWRGHRTVVLPDYQGLGIGNAMIEITAEALWTRERKRFRATTGAPGIIHHRRKHPEQWQLIRGPSNNPAPAKSSQLRKKGRRVAVSAGRLTTSWVYLPISLRSTSDDSEND